MTFLISPILLIRFLNFIVLLFLILCHTVQESIYITRQWCSIFVFHVDYLFGEGYVCIHSFCKNIKLIKLNMWQIGMLLCVLFNHLCLPNWLWMFVCGLANRLVVKWKTPCSYSDISVSQKSHKITQI